MTTLEAIIGIMLIVILGMALVALVFVVLGLDEDIAEHWSKFKKLFKRKTKLEKEIEAAENEVKELTKQIEQINELERLKRERDRLLEKLEKYHSE